MCLLEGRASETEGEMEREIFHLLITATQAGPGWSQESGAALSSLTRTAGVLTPDLPFAASRGFQQWEARSNLEAGL